MTGARQQLSDSKEPRESESATDSDSEFQAAVETARKLVEEAERPRWKGARLGSAFHYTRSTPSEAGVQAVTLRAGALVDLAQGQSVESAARPVPVETAIATPVPLVGQPTLAAALSPRGGTSGDPVKLGSDPNWELPTVVGADDAQERGAAPNQVTETTGRGHEGPGPHAVENLLPESVSTAKSPEDQMAATVRTDEAALTVQSPTTQTTGRAEALRERLSDNPPPRTMDSAPAKLMLARTPVGVNNALIDTLTKRHNASENPHFSLEEVISQDYKTITYEHSKGSISSSHPGPAYSQGSQPPQSGRPQHGDAVPRPLPEQPFLWPILSGRPPAALSKTESPLRTTTRLEIRPSVQPAPQKAGVTAVQADADKFSTTYPRIADSHPPLVTKQTVASRPATVTVSHTERPRQKPGGASKGVAPRGAPSHNPSAKPSAPAVEVPKTSPEDPAPITGLRRGIQAPTSKDPGLHGSPGGDPTPKALELLAPERRPAPMHAAYSLGATTFPLGGRAAGGDEGLLLQAPARSIPGTPPTQTPPGNPAAAESPEAIERVIEMATLHRKSQANQMNVLLRDSRLGRLSLHLVERAGLIDTIVRSDNARTASLINDNMLQLVEALAGKGLQAQAGSQSSGSSSYGDPHSQQQGGRRQQRPFRPKYQADRRAGSFRMEIERGAR